MANLNETDAAALHAAVSDGPDLASGGDGFGVTDVPEVVSQQTQALVRRRPYVALAGAVLAGFLVSRILRRR
jgi:hypothetical protein